MGALGGSVPYTWTVDRRGHPCVCKGVDALRDDLRASMRTTVHGVTGKPTGRQLKGAIKALCDLRGQSYPKLSVPVDRVRALLHEARLAEVAQRAAEFCQVPTAAAAPATAAAAAAAPLTLAAGLLTFGLQSLDVGGAGDCQFRALAHHLLGSADRHGEVRLRAAAELRAHPDRYAPFAEEWDLPSAPALHGRSYAEWLDLIAALGTWGGNATLLAVADAFQRPVHVVTVLHGSVRYTHVQPTLGSTLGDGGVWIAYTGMHYTAAVLALGYLDPALPHGTVPETLQQRLAALQAAAAAGDADFAPLFADPPATTSSAAGSGAAPPPPPTHLSNAERVRTRRRRSELWAATLLTTHEPVNLRQPCPWPLLDQVPFEFRADIVQRFNCVVSDLQTARRVHAANPSAREYRSLLGAWIVLLRIFPAVMLYDDGHGTTGHAANQRMREVLKQWDTGDYRAAYSMHGPPPAHCAARRKPADAFTVASKRAARKGRNGEISKMVAALEAEELAPATLETLEEMRRLHPAPFVPVGCPRRARLDADVRRLARDAPPIELNFRVFERAARSLPRASTTWTPTALIKCVARNKEGVQYLQWVTQLILRVQVPVEIRPLVFDRKLVGLAKQSHHQQSSDAGAARAKQAKQQAPPGRRPPCVWAGEQPECGYPSGVAPVPDAATTSLADVARRVPHPSLACSCPHCALQSPDNPGGAPPVPLAQSDTTRPIGVGDVWYKLAERAISFQHRDRFAAALMGDTGDQTGVGVPGGQSMLTLATEALLRENPELRGLNLDIANMFNTLCRVQMLEDLVNSERICGRDFSWLVPYVHSFYCEGHGAWFWVDADVVVSVPGATVDAGTPGDRPVVQSAGRWEWVASDAGTVQGAPLASFLACFSLLACTRAAKASLRASVAALPADDEQGRRAMASGMADDTTLVARPQHLGLAYAAYASTAAARGWRCRCNKSVMTGDWFVDYTMVAAPTDCGSVSGSDASNGISSATVCYVELLPGVEIQYAAAGFVNLGVPTGRADYVQQQLWKMLDAHDTRLRNIARFAQERGTGVCFDGINVARSLALQALTFSANARDVHFLRALGRERVAAVAARHDASIRATLAIVLGQADLPPVGTAMADVPVDAATAAYCESYPRLVLPRWCGGLGVRQWAPYADAAYVGAWVRSWASSFVEVGGASVCVFPVLQRALDLAVEAMETDEMTRVAMDALWGDPEHVQIAELTAAWEAVVCTARGVRGEGRGYEWLDDTGGKLSRVAMLPRERTQKLLSKAVGVQQRRQCMTWLKSRVGRAVDGVERLASFQKACGQAECGDLWAAQPWMAGGNMSIDSDELWMAAAVRFQLDLPPGGQPAWECGGCGKFSEPVPTGPDAVDVAARYGAGVRKCAYHRLVCNSSSSLWTACHNSLEDAWVAMLVSAGWLDVRTEDRWWDPGAPTGAHAKRPDITAIHPRTHQRWVFDVTVAWTSKDNTRGDPLLAALAAQTHKDTEYRQSVDRCTESLAAERKRQGLSPLPSGSHFSERSHFVPLAFERDGQWGPRAVSALASIVEVAKQGVDVEAFHWSAMNFNRHWRQRVAVALGRGQALIISRAAERAHRRRRTQLGKHSREHSPYDSW